MISKSEKISWIIIDNYILVDFFIIKTYNCKIL